MGSTEPVEESCDKCHGEGKIRKRTFAVHLQEVDRKVERFVLGVPRVVKQAGKMTWLIVKALILEPEKRTYDATRLTWFSWLCLVAELCISIACWVKVFGANAGGRPWIEPDPNFRAAAWIFTAPWILFLLSMTGYGLWIWAHKVLDRAEEFNKRWRD